MKQDMIVVLDLGSHENTVLARAIRSLGVYSEIYPHDLTLAQLGYYNNKNVPPLYVIGHFRKIAYYIVTSKNQNP